MAKKERDDVDTGRRREKGLLVGIFVRTLVLRTFEVNQKAGFAWSFLQELLTADADANR